METVILKPLLHKGIECIGIFSPQNATLNYYFQKKAGAKWSRTNKCWYVFCTEKNYEILAKALSGKAVLQTDELKKYLLEREKNKLPPLTSNQNKIVVKPEPVKPPAVQSKPTQQSNLIRRLNKENVDALQKFKQQLDLKSYSPSTIRTYTNEFRQFLYAINNKPAYEFSVQRIRDYLQYCHVTLKLSEATLHSGMNALYPVGLKK